LGRNEDEPVPIQIDNQSCIALAKNPEHHTRTKHIDIQHHFIREKVENNQVQLIYCPTEEMKADILTKPLSKDKHNKFRNMMGMETYTTNIT
jgi:hypothetical protein